MRMSGATYLDDPRGATARRTRFCLAGLACAGFVLLLAVVAFAG